MRGKILAAALAAALLSGCGSIGQTNAEDLMRAPQFSGQYNQVQKALNSYLGESAQLKYPTGGDNQSPFLFGDWDGSGTEDAAVLYVSTAKGQNVQLAILEQGSSGWRVTQECEGLSSEVSSVSVASLEDAEGSGKQLIVGYGTTQGDLYLGVYRYADETLETVLETAYSEYLLADFTGSGTQDLIIVQNDGDEVQLEALTNGASGYQVAQTLSIAEGRFTGCAGLYSSISRGRHLLAVDGYTGSGGNLASELLYYDADTDRIEPFQSYFEEDIYSATLRNYTVLHSMDVDGDGSVELPSQLTGEEYGEVNTTLDRQLSFVGWYDYTAYSRYSGLKSFGVVDAENGFYLRLPSLWKGKVVLTPGDMEGDWQVRDLETEKLYLTVRIADLGKGGTNLQRAGLLGQQQILIRVSDAAKEKGFVSVAGSVTVL